jgi:hypothetical protein
MASSCLISRTLKVKLCYDRRSVGQSFMVPSPSRVQELIFVTFRQLQIYRRGGALSDERTVLSFRIAACPGQHSHSWVRIPRDSGPYFTVSDSRLSQPGGQDPCIYISKGQGGPAILPSTEFPLRRFLRRAGLWRRCMNPPQHVEITNSIQNSLSLA